MGSIHWSNIIVSMIFGVIGGVVSIWAKHFLYKNVGKISIEINSSQLKYYRTTAYGEQESIIMNSNMKISHDKIKKYNGGEIVLDVDLINNSQINKIMRDIYLQFEKIKIDLNDIKSKRISAGAARFDKINNISLPPQEIKNIYVKGFIKEEYLEEIYHSSYVYLKWKNKKGKQFDKKINIG